MKPVFRAVLAVSAAMLTIAAAPNWNATVAKTAGGHRLGNPDAKVKLTEWVSYTCPHCAHFEQQSEAGVKLMFVHPGTMSVEVRHFIRDKVDLTAALLTNCGDSSKFFGNHSAFLRQQDQWIAKLDALTSAQTNRWNTGTNAARHRAIANDLGFYQIMESRGYSRAQADRCLANQGLAEKLVSQTEADRTAYSVHATPSFAINGKLQEGVHSWLALQLAIANYL